jgi:glycosyltransferase involved in cell wall biosynthesis
MHKTIDEIFVTSRGLRIIVDDYPTDDTRDILSKRASRDLEKIIFHERNQVKGAAVATGIAVATGNIIVIQDANLEYDPMDIPRVIAPIFSVDWSTHSQLVSLAATGHRNHYLDLWGVHKYANPEGRHTDAILDAIYVAKRKTAVFVSRPQGRAVFGKATANFRAALHALPTCPRAEVNSTHVTYDMFVVVTVRNDCP